ncbi:MerR family transcriptional regulator, partial [Actinomadura rubrisoli]
MDGTWTITELAERAVKALAVGESAQVSGRVRDMPNERLIRWYTTIGLVDPPLGRRGRTALYGPRHLRQLVAVKRRQAAGRSIAEIQLELAAATDATLEEIAALPESTPPTSGNGETPPSPRTPAQAPETDTPARGRFWSARPDVSYGRAAASIDYDAARPAVVQGVRLAPDLTLLLEVADLSGDDLAAIQAAAHPLLDELRRRGLAAPPEDPVPLP